MDKNQLGNAIYQAIIGECERMERAGQYRGNGHHLAQRLQEMILAHESVARMGDSKEETTDEARAPQTEGAHIALTLDAFQAEVGAWAKQTYPGRNHDTVQAHFAEEAIEFVGIGRMKAALERAEANLHQRMTSTITPEPVRVPEEGADCGLLLLSWFSLHHNSLMDAMQAKMQINRGRKWADDGRGYMTHVLEEGEQDA